MSSLNVALSSYSTIAVVFERMKIHINERNSNKTPEQAPLFEFTADNVEIMPSKETVKIYKLSIPHSSCTAAKELE
ncbi:unnamed protein product, partial [Gongylonema pulchrum]|uniref:Uncharacterized protein n=1 Tax=Gongylonema pulchrum TaxID=637853 RepID=A0A183DE67_9BILA